MKTEIQNLWVNALRSGEYKQTRERLKDHNGGFCCLGVLCDLYLKENNEDWSLDDDGLPCIEINGFIRYNETEHPPTKVCNWADINSDSPSVKNEYGEPEVLVNLNDNGASFEEIANLIEASGVL